MLSLLKSVLKSFTEKTRITQEAIQDPASEFNIAAYKTESDFASLWKAAERAANEGNQEAARRLLYQTLELEPDNADLLCQLGALESKMALYESAEDNLLTAIHTNPYLIEAYCALGDMLANIKKFDEAVDVFQKAIVLSPNNSSLLCSLANVYLREEKYIEAIRFFQEAIDINNDNAMAYNNLGHCHIKLQNYDAAILPLMISQALDPQNIKVYINLNYFYYTTGELKKAYYYALHGLKIDPKNETLSWALAWSFLLFKRFRSGWLEYESRFSESGQTERRVFNLPLWRGESLSGKTILIAAEQGLGDQIMFASCLKEISSLAQKCILECDIRLSALLQHSFPKINVIGTQHKTEHEVLESLTMPIDFYTHIGYLPSVFRNNYESFFPTNIYLSSQPERISFWQQRLSTLGNGLKVGISWRGGAIQTRSFLRSIPLVEWEPILTTPNVDFINLQYGDSHKDLQECFEKYSVIIHHWPDAINDYLETAALIQSLDLVISVCTSVIHLSGALGQKTWVMVPVSPEWRYLARDKHLPWYRDVCLFRQQTLDKWGPVLDIVANNLAELCQTEKSQQTSEELPAIELDRRDVFPEV